MLGKRIDLYLPGHKVADCMSGTSGFLKQKPNEKSSWNNINNIY